MLIKSLKRHFPARLPEWFQVGLMLSWGCYVILHPQLFSNPASARLFSGLADLVKALPWDAAAIWGLVAMFVATVRGAALFINGAYTRTPLIRLAMSFCSAFIWTQVVVGLMKSGVPNTGLVVYSGLVVLDIVSSMRAASDAVYADVVRREMKQGRKYGVHSSILA